MSKLITGIAVAVALAFGIVAMVLETGALDIPLADLEAKYKTADSQFADIDGIRVHYTDQGPRDAPVLVMLHASYMHLRTFDAMAKPLSAKYRVVRFDFPIAGLTGPDPKERYSIELNMMVLDQLTKQLGIEKFALFGTSSGGPVAFRYAAENPDRVTRMILVNSAGMPRTAVTDPNRPRGSAIGRWFSDRWQTKGRLRDNLTANFTSVPPPAWLIDMNYEIGRRQGQRREGAIYINNFKTGDPEATLGKVKAPTLIMWGMDNPTVMHLEANVMSLWLTNAPSLVIKYPKVAHYLYMEIPDQVANDVMAFLDGAKDVDLRITQRVPIASTN